MAAPGMQGKSWQNPDLYKIANGLGMTATDVAPVPLLQQILDALEIMPSRIPPANLQIKTFNINDEFFAALQAWYASGAASIIVRTEYLEDETGTKIYMITYA